MNWIKVLLLIATLTFSNAETPVGSWTFDTKASVKKHKEFARIYSRLEGMQTNNLQTTYATINQNRQLNPKETS